MSEKPEIIFSKSSNHIYEVCENFAVLGVTRVPGGSSITLELCREVIEIKEGKISSDAADEAQITRLNFATISMTPACARRLMKRLEQTLDGFESKKDNQVISPEQE